jgi:glycosyltransferase involved in cell wall biosynthesis
VPGTRIVVGDGPALEELRVQHPDVVFLGPRRGEELARCYSEADVFVFPSLIETFGLVVLEALASGVPVAARPLPHLVEIFQTHGVISFDDDLDAAAERARAISPALCRQVAEKFSWRACAEQFISIIDSDRRRSTC